MGSFVNQRRIRRALAMSALLAVGMLIPNLITVASHQFSDVPDSNGFHADIDALVDSGVTQGCGPSIYCPSDDVTREQMAAFLNRLGALGPGKTPVVNADKVDGFDSNELGAMRLGPVETTALVGGTGGGPYTLTCPEGSVATGLVGDLGSIEPPTVGHVAVTCTPVILGTGYVMALGASTLTGTSGDGGGGPYSIQCAHGSVMVGVAGSTKPVFGGAATVIASLSIQCTPLGGAGVTLVVGQPNPMGSTPFSRPCPVTKVVTGLGPASGDQLLDSLRVRCQ
jgi:hypothetical protein